MYKQAALGIEEICKKLRPIFGDKIDKIYLNYVTSENRETKEELASMLNALYQKHFDKLLDCETLLEPPLANEVAGEYNLGNVSYFKKEIHPFNLREKDFPRHICITGMSGSGKTTLAFNVLEALTAKNKPFLVFDWKKSFRPLLARDEKITCFTVGDNTLTNKLKLNVNRPPAGISPKEWITVLCDLIAESFFVSYGVHKVILETLDEAFTEWGVYKGSKNYPTWNHIKWRLEERLDKAKSREQGWIESALRVATVLTFGDFGEVLNYKGENAINIEDIFDKRVILELNSLGNVEKKFFSEFVLMYIYKQRKAEKNRVNGDFNYAILVDEAHNIFLKDKTKFVSESVTDMVYREMREYGTSLICLDQHISKISDTVKGNSACHIIFQQQLPEDIDEISRITHLGDKKEMFSRLTVGEGVVKLSERYTRPFFIKVPNNLNREFNVTEEQVRQRASRFHLINDIDKGVDSEFITQTVSGGSFDINTLFANISLPKSIPLRARENLAAHGKVEKEVPSNEAIETIYATIKRRLRDGEELHIIERQMEAIYDQKEVMRAVNRVLDEQMKAPSFSVKEKTVQEDKSVLNEKTSVEEKKVALPVERKQEIKKSFFEIPKARVHKAKETEEKVYKESPRVSSNYSDLNEEESKFIAFLEKHPKHDLTTVELYKKLGLSPRKGNRIKDLLLEKKLLTIMEVRNDKGWKKIIRLS